MSGSPQAPERSARKLKQGIRMVKTLKTNASSDRDLSISTLLLLFSWKYTFFFLRHLEVSIRDPLPVGIASKGGCERRGATSSPRTLLRTWNRQRHHKRVAVTLRASPCHTRHLPAAAPPPLPAPGSRSSCAIRNSCILRHGTSLNGLQASRCSFK